MHSYLCECLLGHKTLAVLSWLSNQGAELLSEGTDSIPAASGQQFATRACDQPRATGPEVSHYEDLLYIGFIVKLKSGVKEGGV